MRVGIRRFGELNVAGKVMAQQWAIEINFRMPGVLVFSLGGLRKPMGYLIYQKRTNKCDN